MEIYTNLIISVAFFVGLYSLLNYLKKSNSGGGATPQSSHGKVKILYVDSEFDRELVNAGDMPAIVDFTATWCGPCQRIAPYFAELSEQYGNNMLFLKVDVDQLKATSQKCGIRAMPTFQVFLNGRKIDEVVGASPDALKRLIEKNLKK